MISQASLFLVCSSSIFSGRASVRLQWNRQYHAGLSFTTLSPCEVNCVQNVAVCFEGLTWSKLQVYLWAPLKPRCVWIRFNCGICLCQAHIDTVIRLINMQFPLSCLTLFRFSFWLFFCVVFDSFECEVQLLCQVFLQLHCFEALCEGNAPPSPCGCVSRMTFTDVSQCLCCVTLNLHWLTVQK